ncbi:glycosyl transferase group 1 [Rhodopirellula sallentina SM41]|uniref:Glycosyl transferase group 1 n=2 Tax=Rhodopirellula TaxID=265488 RepID=M5U9L5_9BACT|nr:glycosyl transferase group 1 [Rhodopirellula sallentina SM41]
MIFSHPTGNANSRAVLEGLCKSSLLSEFRTCVATYPGNRWSKLAHTPFGREFQRREFPETARSRTRQRPSRELIRMLANRASLAFLTRHETGPFCVDAVYRDLDRTVARRIKRQPFSAVYAYEDGALESFRVAKKRGGTCLYDLPIGYWRAAQSLLATERERWPEWAATMPGFRDSEAKLARKDEELQLADQIYVASQFTRRTLEDYPGTLANAEVIPYGFPSAGPPREYVDLKSRKLKVLFVGGLSQRKGIADVFAVADALSDHVELTVVGRANVQGCPALESALKKHHWIPSLPHEQVLQTMREHDVLLFPSLFEGFGLVITEAMSQGTPVITTDRTAGPDVITHGEDGWIIPAGDTASLQSAVENLLDAPGQLATAGEHARQTAMRRPWSTYGNELAASVKQLLEATRA